MKLNQIFQKPVDRAIEGVIKADDESSLALEVEEYVLTHEVSQRMETFLEAYNNYQGANGAWVSGFFGSGKSYLLKMLALLLENRVVDGIPVLERFLPKCEGNAILKASLQKAAAIPARSILFNIDQKADVISKTQLDALLAVFVKVFDEMCGYYGKQGYIAAFERDLDRRGVFHDFRSTFAEISGLDWELGREQALLEADNIARTYAQVTLTPLEPAHHILDRYRADYHVSIEDFANQVSDYLKTQTPNFRLNFLVDEVGQYIANNTKLMTNLQTIAESLATKCRGRSWIIVTAQAEMKNVIGEMNKSQANDFSKIQARFLNRLNLTSQNVAEVIQKRLLSKNPSGALLLETLYQQQANNFGTLFDFTDGSIHYRSFHDQQHFIHIYPFIPYQIALFQAAIQGLSEHEAFEGKHSSVGERSMLAVFQQVAVQIANHEVGQLATFDLMFEGIRNALKANTHQRAVLTAENHLGSPFAVRVLKTLFLVKYVKEFKASLHNLSVLMIGSFGGDPLALQREVETALNLLEQQTYIQRSGELYEYLTNEEKDVEQEIKNTEVPPDAVSEQLQKMIFDQILADRKIRIEEVKQDFNFTRKLDDQAFGRDYETTIHVISPFHEYFEQEETLRMHSLGRDELLVLLPADLRLMQDLKLYKQTEKYVLQNNSATQQAGLVRILSEKALQNRSRAQQLEKRLRDLLGKARLFVGGSEIDFGGGEAQSRVVRGFHELIKRTYPNLKMLHGVVYTESEIESHMRLAQANLLGGMAVLPEAAQEMLTKIQANSRDGKRTTFKSLAENFERKPYGWPLAAVQCNLALLVAHAKLEVRQDANLLDETTLVRALRNTQTHANLILDPLVVPSAAELRRLKEFYGDFFDRPAQASEGRDLGKETAAALQERIHTLAELAANRSAYPFLSELSAPLNRLRELAGRPYTFYLTELPAQMESLLDLNEQTVAPLLKFWKGPQKTIYDEARQFYLSHKDNFDYLEGDEPARLTEMLKDSAIYQGSRVQQLRTLVESLRLRLERQVEVERQSAAAALRTRLARLAGMPDFAALTPTQRASIESQFATLISQLAGQTLIAKLRETVHSFEEQQYPRLLAQIEDWSHPKPPPPPPGRKTGPLPPPPSYISLRSVPVAFAKPSLVNSADVEAYLNELRAALLKEIENGRRINI